MPPLVGSEAVALLARIRDYAPSQIRHRISAEELVFETGHRLCAPVPKGLLGDAPRDFFQVVVSFEGETVVISARHVVQHQGQVLVNAARPFPQFAYSRTARGCVAHIGRKLAQIIRRPSLLIPSTDRWFPKTGMPMRIDG